jgi:hypothetical protein
MYLEYEACLIPTSLENWRTAHQAVTSLESRRQQHDVPRVRGLPYSHISGVLGTSGHQAVTAEDLETSILSLISWYL